MELYKNYTKEKLPAPEKKISGEKHVLLFCAYCFIARYCVYLIRNESHKESLTNISYSLSIVLDDYEEY